jgi:hypothetical protein
MRTDRLVLGVVLMVSAASGVAPCGETGASPEKTGKAGKRRATLRVVGNDLATVKMVFDPAAVDRSTPEGAARAFLLFMANTRELKVGMNRLQLAIQRKVMDPVLTEACKKAIFGAQEKQLTRIRNATEKSVIKFPAREAQKNGEVLLSFDMTTRTSISCYACGGSGKREKAACDTCKASGTYVNNWQRKGQLLLARRKDVWLTRTFFLACWHCKGAGKCLRFKTAKPAKTAPGGGVPPPPCSRCKDPEKCYLCAGTGRRKQTPFGSSIGKGVPKPEPFTADLSSPRTAFASLGKALRLRTVVRWNMGNRLATSSKAFRKFLLLEPSPLGTSAFSVDSCVLLKLKVLSAAKARIWYRKGAPASELTKAAAARPNGWVTFERGKDGLWRAGTFHTACSFCKSTGKTPLRPGQQGDQTPCAVCEGAGGMNFKRLP